MICGEDNELEWIDEFLNAETKICKANGELAGHLQKWESLAIVVVLGPAYLP